MGTPYSHDTDVRTSSPLIRASATIDIPTQSQAWVPVYAKLRGLIVIQPEQKLFEKHELVCTNEVPEVNPNKMFSLLIANFANQKRQILKKQVVVSALVGPVCLVRSTLNTKKVLGITDKRPETDEENGKAVGFPRTLPSATRKEETKESLDTLKLDHLPVQRQQAVLQILSKHCSTWSGQLGQIITVQHRIAMQPGLKSCTHWPYRARPTVRATIQKNMDAMLQEGVIEPSQSDGVLLL